MSTHNGDQPTTLQDLLGPDYQVGDAFPARLPEPSRLHLKALYDATLAAQQRLQDAMIATRHALGIPVDAGVNFDVETGAITPIQDPPYA